MREPCSRAVVEVPKDSYRRHRPWLCHLLIALLLPEQVGPGPKLLLALVQGMGQTIPTLGLSALEEQQPPFLPSYLPSHSRTPVPSLPLPMWSSKAAEQRGPTFSLSHTRSEDAQAGL